MDKKNTTIGAILLIGAFAALYFSPKPPSPPPSRQISSQANSTAPAPGTPGMAVEPVANAPASTSFAAVTADDSTAIVTALANDFIEARFTDFGGALREVALKKYPDTLGNPAPYVFNAVHAEPMLALVDYPGLGRNVRYERLSQTASEVVYRAVVDGKLEVTRRYTLAPNSGDNTDPYQIRHETTFRNLTDQTVPSLRIGLSLGTAAPTKINDDGLQLTTGYSTAKDQNFIRRGDLESGSGFVGMGAHDAKPSITSPGPVVWAAVKNQFFTSILTPDEPGTSLVTQRVKLLKTLPNENHSAYGITGTAQMEVKALAPQGDAKLAANFYVGPKEYTRLSKTGVFKADQDKIMQFGFFKWFSAILLTLMTWIHSFVGNWGLAIVLTTLTLKTIFIPFTLAASRSAKRMAKIQPQLQALKEKYKDNPQKQQAATLEIFKANKVNPVGGCLPILITIPFFMGFFSMLQSAAELRFAPFLWAHDLASEDTVAMIPYINYPLNILPLLMGATMIFQMRLTPSPTVDNAQAKMMKFMPVIFTLFCYRFSCALSLYSFTNGVFTIIQQLVINKMKDPVDAPAPTKIGDKPLKNVTPGKKK